MFSRRIGMRVLVTGGAGFIGSHLVRSLEKKHMEPVVLDNFSTGLWENLPKGTEVIELDLCDASLPQRLKERNIDAVVHLAAQTSVAESIHNPQNDARINVMGTINLLETMRHLQIPRVIFASSAAVYGDIAEEDLPIIEDMTGHPLSFYGLSKQVVERYLESYHEIFGMDYVVLRFANVYGERQGDGGEGGVISIFARQLILGQNITIHGDGKQTRDFVYAGDIAEGICAALITPNICTAYNLGTQTETSLLELVEMLAEISGRKIKPLFDSRRDGDILRSALSSQKAASRLSWKAGIPIKEGLYRTYKAMDKK